LVITCYRRDNRQSIHPQDVRKTLITLRFWRSVEGDQAGQV
jgi:hypothetical protein